MIPFLILSISRYCSFHFAGKGCGFSSVRIGIGFLLEDFGLGGRAGEEVDTGVAGGSSFGFFLAEGEIGICTGAAGSLEADLGVTIERVERRSDVYGVERLVEGDDGSSLTGGVEVIRVTRESIADRVERRGVDDILTRYKIRPSQPFSTTVRHKIAETKMRGRKMYFRYMERGIGSRSLVPDLCFPTGEKQKFKVMKSDSAILFLLNNSKETFCDCFDISSPVWPRRSVCSLSAALVSTDSSTSAISTSSLG